MEYKRKEALRYITDSLTEKWDRLVTQALSDLDRNETDEDWIVYRYAILTFALDMMPQTHDKEKFIEQINYYI